MTIVRSVALFAGRATGFMSRRLGLGGGTTLPGVVAQTIDRQLVPSICTRLNRGVLLVTGTNGKTTTARMLAQILQKVGWHPIHNRAGANLVEGIATALLYASDLQGRPAGDSGLFEVDEAHLPRAVSLCQPRLVLLHNLFRDQLDRYGEVDYVIGRWGKALRTLPPTAAVVLNADDPAVADLGSDLDAKTLYYGVDVPTLGRREPDHTADAQFCRRCGFPYTYAPAYYGHIGRYRCSQCGHARPQPDVYLTALDLKKTTGSYGHLVTPVGEYDIALPLPGLYNAYNALAAITAALALLIEPPRVLSSLATFQAAFGRLERVQAEGREILLALIKNPVGAGQVLDMLNRQAEVPHSILRPYMVVINDRIADGKDVSWLWDANFEMMAGRVGFAVVSGTRAQDMALRLKYAGIEENRILTEPNLANALDLALSNTEVGDTLYLLPTYTAMLEVRALMARRGYTPPFWED
jgi:UDP-N-acetylmuramyl tripeptide synthase